MKIIEYHYDNEEYVNINPTFKASNEYWNFLILPNVSSITYDKEAKLFIASDHRGNCSMCGLDAEAFQLFINQCQEYLNEVKNG